MENGHVTNAEHVGMRGVTPRLPPRSPLLNRVPSFRLFGSEPLHVRQPQGQHVIARTLRQPVLPEERAGALRLDDLAVMIDGDQRAHARSIAAASAPADLVSARHWTPRDDAHVVGRIDLSRVLGGRRFLADGWSESGLRFLRRERLEKEIAMAVHAFAEIEHRSPDLTEV